MTSVDDTSASDASGVDGPWYRWRVAPTSGFEVQDPAGNVGLIQVTASGSTS